jgi:predicted dehydrogenase
MKRNEVSFIGLGYWGPNLLRNMLAARPGTAARFICDRDHKRVDRFTHVADYATTDDSCVISDHHTKAVVIATPLHTHYELAKRALDSGKHVFVEKPLCTTRWQCDDLIARADNRHLVLAVGHVYLFNDVIKHAKTLIASGELGDVYYAFSTRTNLGPFRYDASAMWDLAAHDVSIFNFWFGKPLSVTSSEVKKLGVLADVSLMSMRHACGVTSHVHASWLNPRKVREITVVGSKKTLVIDEMNAAEPVRIYDREVDASEAGISVRYGAVTAPFIRCCEPLAAECRHFLDVIDDLAEGPINGGSVAADVVSVLEAADASSGSLSKEVDVA